MKYTSEHEYVKLEGEEATIGISEHAQQQLGDIVFVELPEVGKAFNKGDEIAVIESVKAASELYAPISGTITQINEELDINPALVNSSPQDKGWIFKIKLSNVSELDELMDEEAYASHIG